MSTVPEGRMTWWDDNVGTGRVESATGAYLAHREDVEPDARAEGAMVEFDAVRERGLANDRAANVRLRRGTRSDPDQGRFGEQRS